MSRKGCGHDVQKLLADHLAGYDKDGTPFLDTLLPGVAQARTRAARLEREAAEVGEEGRNPSTGVHHLVDVLDSEVRVP